MNFQFSLFEIRVVKSFRSSGFLDLSILFIWDSWFKTHFPTSFTGLTFNSLYLRFICHFVFNVLLRNLFQFSLFEIPIPLPSGASCSSNFQFSLFEIRNQTKWDKIHIRSFNSLYLRFINLEACRKIVALEIFQFSLFEIPSGPPSTQPYWWLLSILFIWDSSTMSWLK